MPHPTDPSLTNVAPAHPVPVVRRAVIDVGTNSVKVLVADVGDHVVVPVIEESEQTRLGAGFFQTHQLQSAAIAHTARAVADFARMATARGAEGIRVIATSAARDALNQADLLTAISAASGLKVEILSGEAEADWVYRGVTSDPELAHIPLLLLDVGGGSTEFILGAGTGQQFRHSFQLGTVRFLEATPLSDPPTPTELVACREWVNDFLAREVRPLLSPALAQARSQPGLGGAPVLVGTGGTTAILARMEAGLDHYDRNIIDATRLPLPRLHARVAELWSLPLARRKLIPGMPGKRADVILPGVVIFESLMQMFGFDELRVSTRGLRFAAVMAPWLPG